MLSDRNCSLSLEGDINHDLKTSSVFTAYNRVFISEEKSVDQDAKIKKIGLERQYDEIAESWDNALLNDDNNKDSNSAYFSLFNFSLDGKFVLDLGCGNGCDLYKIKLKGARIFGIDSSKEMVQAAKIMNPEGEILETSFEKDFPFKNETFDFVISKWALQTACEIDPIYKEIHRVLKKDGQLIYLTSDPIRQFIEKKQNGKDYFKQEMVTSTFFNGQITVREPSHTMNDYLSDTFNTLFHCCFFKQGHDNSAEQVNGDKYPSYFMIKANKR